MVKLDIFIRVCSGLVIVFSAILMGYMGRSQWTILLLGLVFAVLYLLGKRALPNDYFSRGAFVKQFAVTYVVQVILYGVLYLIGRGLGSLVIQQPIAPFSLLDVYFALVLLLFGVVTTLWLHRLEKNKSISTLGQVATSIHARAEGDKTSTEYRCEYILLFQSDPITLDTFFESVFYGHIERDASGQRENANSLPEAAKPSAKLIAETEARLGVLFPPLLKQLYLRQNGGDVGNLWVPCVNQPTNDLAQWRGVFSHDYCYLAPLQQLTTLYDSYLDYMDEEEITQSPHVQKHAKDYVILCQRYADTTFLDYSQSKTQPRVGVVDFDGIEKNDVWFDTFDDFFAALRRGELIDRP